MRRERDPGWVWGIAASHAELDEADLRFWLRARPLQRLEALWALSAEMRLLRGEREAAPRLRGAPGGVRRARRALPARRRVRRNVP
jgi:hypothetical protein